MCVTGNFGETILSGICWGQHQRMGKESTIKEVGQRRDIAFPATLPPLGGICLPTNGLSPAAAAAAAAAAAVSHAPAASLLGEQETKIKNQLGYEQGRDLQTPLQKRRDDLDRCYLHAHALLDCFKASAMQYFQKGKKTGTYAYFKWDIRKGKEIAICTGSNAAVGSNQILASWAI
eukprot:1159481-Pelagomonas_calceolata.AAC.2